MMAYAPSELVADGEVTVYEPPTVQDVFNLKANRDVPISNGPEAVSTDYLRHLADEGRIVVVASDDETVLRMADEVIEM